MAKVKYPQTTFSADEVRRLMHLFIEIQALIEVDDFESAWKSAAVGINLISERVFED